jgi:hypothetical protein
MLTGNQDALISALAAHRGATKRVERELMNSRSAISTLGDDAVAGQDDTLIARLDMTEFDATDAEVARILVATELEPVEELV